MTHPSLEIPRGLGIPLLALLAVAAAAGCQGVTGLSLSGTGDGGSGGGGTLLGGGGGGGGNPDSGSAGGGSDGGTLLDVPCDVYAVLSTYCWACHGPTPTNGAPQSLVTLAQLQAPSPSYSTQSNGERAVVRMADGAAPMPPAGNSAPSTAEQATFAAWVDAGMPSGSCTTDGGLPDAGPPDPLNAAPTCTSGQSYTSGESSTMEPGVACISCHQSSGGPRFTVAGTVFPTGHEPDKCDAPASSGAVVTVTDSAGVTASFTANSVGNFSGNASLTFPITAVVSFDGRTRAMTTPVASGDCNSCHTQTGANGAPGRVTLPP
jgi:hypothetical protein